jgi:hypothetical protein
MNTSKHTPGPWVAIKNGPRSTHICDSTAHGRTLVASVPAGCKDGETANAARIVQCVNAHDGLVEAIDDLIASYIAHVPEADARSNAIAHARAVLAAAGVRS